MNIGIDRCLGQWQAYVEHGATKQIQYDRLKLVPDTMRDQVIGHMKTVIKIREKANE